MAQLYSTRYKDTEITCRAGTAQFDASGHADVPDDKAAEFVSGLRDTVLVVKEKPKSKKKVSPKKTATKEKTTKKKRGKK